MKKIILAIFLALLCSISFANETTYSLEEKNYIKLYEDDIISLKNNNIEDLYFESNDVLLKIRRNEFDNKGDIVVKIKEKDDASYDLRITSYKHNKLQKIKEFQNNIQIEVYFDGNRFSESTLALIGETDNVATNLRGSYDSKKSIIISFTKFLPDNIYTTNYNYDFMDLEDEWVSGITKLVTKGIIDGVDPIEDIFGANNSMTYLEFEFLAKKLFGVTTIDNPLNIAKNAKITREEAVVLLNNLFIQCGINYDLKDSIDYVDLANSLSIESNIAISNMTKAGVVSGYTDQTFKASKLATRAEVAVMFGNVFEIINRY